MNLHHNTELFDFYVSLAITDIKDLVLIWLPLTEPNVFNKQKAEESSNMIVEKFLSYESKQRFKLIFSVNIEDILDREVLKDKIITILYAVSSMFVEQNEEKQKVIKDYEANIRSIMEEK